MKPLVIYHANCTDGFGAAFAAWLKMGDEADFLPMQYKPRYEDEDISSPENRDVYVLDFSFPRPIMEDIFNRAKRVVWLDHHKSAFEMWCGGIPECGWHEEGDSVLETHNRWIQLDNNKSGALLAWEYFHPGSAIPLLIRHIDDRDRWQFKLEGSKELHAALASYKPWAFKQWEEWGLHYPGVSEQYWRMRAEGAAILRAQDAAVQSMAKHSRKCAIDLRHAEHWRADAPEGLAVNAGLHHSELGHELANQSGTYGLIWYVGANKKVKCSLRSNGDYDVSSIAQAFGGGGHRNAAGFETDIDTLMGWLS